MAKRVRPINLDKAVAEVLKEYGDECFTVLSESVEEVANEAVQKLQAVNRFAPGRTPSGDYAKDWTQDEVQKGRMKTSRVVHNLDHYRLTHLLEKGHVSRNGTHRTFGFVKAYPHIAPVNDWANKELPQKVKERLSK